MTNFTGTLRHLYPNSPSCNLQQQRFGFSNRIEFDLLMKYSYGMEAFRVLLTKFFLKSFAISFSLNESFCWQLPSKGGLTILFSYSRLHNAQCVLASYLNLIFYSFSEHLFFFWVDTLIKNLRTGFAAFSLGIY